MAWLASACPVAGQQQPDGASAAPSAAPTTLREKFTDPHDGQFDVSYFLEHPYGFLPVPIIVTEPAVGYGGGMAAMFLRPRHEAGAAGWVRPNISAIGGAATDNGTWFGFAGDSSYWYGGRLKTLLGAGTGRVNLDFYGLGSGPFQDVGIAYSLNLTGGLAGADWQVIPGQPWWLGLRYAYAEVDPQLRNMPLFPGLVDRIRTTISAPIPQLAYDSRDSVFTPRRGLYSETTYLASHESLGASVQFSRFGQTVMGWVPVHASVTLALRADYASASGGAPFYMLPYVDMRGVPAMRYAGDRMTSGQAEVRWQFLDRWSVVAFGGVGETRLERGRSTLSQDVSAGGAGFRYEIARKFGMHVGIDVAHSPGTNAFYIIVGNAWFRP